MHLLRRGVRPLWIGIIVLVLSAAYLAGPARDTMDATAAAVVFLHLGLGIVLILPVGVALIRAARHIAVRTVRTGLCGPGLLAALCAFTGIYLAARAAAGHSTAHDLVAARTHSVTGAMATLLGICFAWFRHRAQSPPQGNPSSGLTVPGSPSEPSRLTAIPVRDPSISARKLARIMLQSAARPRRAPLLACAVILLTLTQGALFGAAALLPEYRAGEYYRDLTATNARQADNPLYPAGLRLAPETRLLKSGPDALPVPPSAKCGDPGCHRAQWLDWQSSAHHHSGSDPFYRAALEETIRSVGADQANWCQGCHSPQAVIESAGSHAALIDRAAAGAEGVSCYTCHATVGSPTRTGDGRCSLEDPQDYPFADAVGWRRGVHDFLLRVRPGPHQRAYLKPELHPSAEFCSSCHRQTVTVSQNHNQFMRGPDEYGEWAKGPWSARTARARRIEIPRTCQDCHGRSSAAGGTGHLAPGGNIALAALSQDAAVLDAARSLLRRAISLDLFALRRSAGHDRPGETIAPLDSPLSSYSIHPGDTCWLEVVVRNSGDGHNFPAGYPDLTQAWLEVAIRDPRGNVRLMNGVADTNRNELPADAHIYGGLSLDRHGLGIAHHVQLRQAAAAYRRTITAGGADIARYRFVVPRTTGVTGATEAALHISVRLRYRSVRPDFAAWALPRDSHQAPPPVITIAETSLDLPLRRDDTNGSAVSGGLRSVAADRFIAYGMALLAPQERPDIGAAVEAFTSAARLAPDSPDPWLALGRAYMREPDLMLASTNFERALRCAPGYPAAAAELAVVYNKQGQPDRSIGILAPLIEAFPEDGALQYDLGLALFRKGRYQEAAAAFRRALAIDPDDSAAHFELKRCYDGLRSVTEARREDSITRYLAEDPSTPQLVQQYLNTHHEAALRADPLPVHMLK